MCKKLKRVVLIITALLLFSIGIVAQIPAPPLPLPTPPLDADDTIKISTTLIQIDVTVTDKDGNVITDLKPEEIEIYENGKKREVTNFSFIPQSTKNNTPEAVDTTNQQKGKDFIVIPPKKIKPEQVRRTYALVVDDLGISFENINWVKQNLKKFVNQQMQDGDLVAVIRTGSGIGTSQSFTSDKRQLLSAIDKIRWNAYGRGGISSFSPIGTSLSDDLNGTVKSDGTVRNVAGNKEEKEFNQLIDDFRSDNFSVGTLGALNYIIRGMQDLPGRKSILLLSEGFILNSTNAPNRVVEAMRVLADKANRASVVIYTLDPTGLTAPGFSAQDVVTDIFPGSPADNALQDREANFRDKQSSLRFLAYETGGIPFLNQNNLSKGLEKAINDQNGYYLLGYEPDESTFDPKKSKFNKLELKVTRPGLKIRYRSGFFGITDEKIQNIPKTPQEKLVGALTSPFGSNDINLNLYPIFQNDAKEGNLIHTLVYIDIRDLTFAKEAEGLRKANFDILAMTFKDNGIPINQLAKNYTIELKEENYQNLLSKGFIYTISIPIKDPGGYQFRIALRDTSSNNIGSVSQYIEVPKIKKKLVISNIILDDFSIQEWENLKQTGGSAESERNALLDSTIREFKSGTILRYDYVIYNPKTKQQIQTELRLIRDGKVIYQEKPTAVKTVGQGDPTRLQNAGAISLGKNLEPGSYALQIVVYEDENPKNFATQFVEFEIVN